MAKVKVKRHDTFIDMTAMSDVTVLLLTFFMLTSTFTIKEPVLIITPASVSEIKIPDINIMTILIEPSGAVYMSMDKQLDKIETLKDVARNYNITFTQPELDQFGRSPSFGVPIGRMKEYLALDPSDQDKVILQLGGIPMDSTNNQLKVWIESAQRANSDLKFAIKADQTTKYHTVKGVIDVLLDLRINRYNLITSLRTGDDMPDEPIIN